MAEKGSQKVQLRLVRSQTKKLGRCVGDHGLSVVGRSNLRYSHMGRGIVKSSYMKGR